MFGYPHPVDSQRRAFVRFVYANSTPMHWRGPKSAIHRYTDIDGQMFWCAEFEEILVNRAKVHEPDAEDAGHCLIAPVRDYPRPIKPMRFHHGQDVDVLDERFNQPV